MTQLTEQQLHSHVQILGWLRIVGAGLLAVVGIALLAFLSGLGVITGDPTPLAILVMVGLFTGGLMVALALPGFIAGIGLLRRKNWGRILAMVVGFFDLFSFPIGTAIAGYTFYVLLQDSANAYFAAPSPTQLVTT